VIGEPRLYDLSDRALAIIHWSVAGILILRETYVTVLRQWAESHGINFAATASGKIKMFVQSFAIGTVIIKEAHVPTAAWGNWFTSAVLVAMVAVTVVSGITATQRKPT
jgi:phosphatidylglycerophosphate synthase